MKLEKGNGGEYDHILLYMCMKFLRLKKNYNKEEKKG